MSAVESSAENPRQRSRVARSVAQSVTQPTVIAALAWALGGAVSCGLFAGEPIVFSKQKSVAAPEADTRGTKERLTELANKQTLDATDVGAGRPSSSAPRMFAPARPDRKTEKKLKDAKTEKENWVLYNPGDLQEAEEKRTEFGVGEGIEKEQTTAEIWFSPKRSRPGKTSKSDTAGAREPAPNRPAHDEEDDAPTAIIIGKAPKDTERAPAASGAELRNALAPRTDANAGPDQPAGETSLGSSRSSAGRQDFGLRATEPAGNAGSGNPILGQGFGNREPGAAPPSPRLFGSDPLGPSVSRPGSPGPFGTSPGFKDNLPPRTDFAPGSTRPAFGGK